MRLQRFAQRRQRALEAGALAIEPVEDDEPRAAPSSLGRRPDFFGLHHHARRPRRRRPARRRRRAARRARRQEIAHARRVDQVDLLLVPLGVGEAGRQRVLPRDFLFVEIGDGRAVVDLAEAIDHAGIGEDGRGELCLAGAAVSDERDVSDAGGVVDLHNGVPLDGSLKGESYSPALGTPQARRRSRTQRRRRIGRLWQARRIASADRRGPAGCRHWSSGSRASARS